MDFLVNCAAGNFLATAENLTPNGFRTGTVIAPSSTVGQVIMQMYPAFGQGTSEHTLG
jgi:hypothetical protein